MEAKPRKGDGSQWPASHPVSCTDASCCLPVRGTPRGTPSPLCRGPRREGLGPTHLLQSFLFFPSQIKVPLNHFPDVLGLFIRELGKIQFSPHLACRGHTWKRQHHRWSPRKPGTAAKPQSKRQSRIHGVLGSLSGPGWNVFLKQANLCSLKVSYLCVQSLHPWDSHT